MPSSTLPFFVRHGEIVSVLAFLVPVLVVLLSVLALYRFTRRKANRATKTLLESLGAVTLEKNFTAGQDAVLEGVLQTIPPTGSNDSATESHLPLDIAEGIEGLELRGKSNWVISGKTQILWNQNLSLSPDELRTSIERGDRVRIAGTLQKNASPDQTGANYREEAATWALEGTRRSPLRVVSCETTRPKIRIKRMLWTSISAVVLLFFFTQCVGSTAIGYAEDSQLQVSGGDIEYPLSLQIASAIPYYRTQAVEILRQKLWDRDLGQVGSAHLVNWHIANRDCAEAAQMALERGHLDWANEVVRSCPKSKETSQIAFSIYLRRGEFDLAVEKLEDAKIASIRERQADSVDSVEATWWMSSDLAAKVYVLAGRFDRVAMLFTSEAESLEAWGAQLRESLAEKNSDEDTPASNSDEDEPGTNSDNDGPSADSVRVSAAIYRCLAALAKHYDGQAIQTSDFAGDTSLCRLAESEVLPLSERSVALKAIDEAGTPWALSAIAELLIAQYNPIPLNRSYRFRFIESTYSFQHMAADLVSGRHFRIETKALGLSASLARSLEGDLPSPRRAVLLLNRSYSEALFGKMKLAKATVLLVTEDLLALSPAWLTKHVTPQSDGTIKSTDWDKLVPDDKSHDSHLAEFLIPEFEKTELLLAALSVREHDKESAATHVANARNLQRYPRTGDFYKGDSDSELAYLLGTRPSEYRYGASSEQTAQFLANPGKFRSRFLLYTSPLQHTNMWLSDLLRHVTLLADADVPQWKEELYTSRDHWYDALMVRECSLYLDLLEAL